METVRSEEAETAAGDASGGDRCAICGGGGHLVQMPIVSEDEFAAVCDACVEEHNLFFLLDSDDTPIPEEYDSDGGAHYDMM